MADVDMFALQKSNLNGFLFAEVGIEANGNTLSVLSAFARAGMDPWQEGGRLSRMPRGAAIEALGGIIMAMPESLRLQHDAKAIAARLVALLPARGASSSTPGAVAAAPTAVWAIQWTVILTTLAILLVGVALSPITRTGLPSGHDPVAHGAANQLAIAAMPGADQGMGGQ